MFLSLPMPAVPARLRRRAFVHVRRCGGRRRHHCDLKFHDQRSDAGNTVSRGFCPHCGSPIMNLNSGHPDSRYVHAVTLDEPSTFKPTAVVFREFAQPWDHVGPALS